MGSQLLQRFTSRRHVALGGQSETDLYYTSRDIHKAVKLFNTMLGVLYHGIRF